MTTNPDHSKFTMECDLSELQLISLALHDLNAKTKQTNDCLDELAQTVSDEYFNVITSTTAPPRV